VPRDVRARAPKSKNIVKRRLETLEKIQTDGIDWLAHEVRGLYHNEQLLASAMEEQDNLLAAMRALLVGKGICTNQEIDDKKKEVEGIRQRAIEAQKEQEQEQEQAREKEAQEALQPDPEMDRMKRAAESAAGEGHPTEAFIFGGS